LANFWRIYSIAHQFPINYLYEKCTRPRISCSGHATHPIIRPGQQASDFHIFLVGVFGVTEFVTVGTELMQHGSLLLGFEPVRNKFSALFRRRDAPRTKPSLHPPESPENLRRRPAVLPRFENFASLPWQHATCRAALKYHAGSSGPTSPKLISQNPAF